MMCRGRGAAVWRQGTEVHVEAGSVEPKTHVRVRISLVISIETSFRRREQVTILVTFLVAETK